MEVEKLREALEAYQEFNRVRNDLDAFLFEFGKWALGEITEKPDPKDFGIV